MAGSGYKLYLTGDVLSATDVNNYLQEQTVMRFASSAARTSALSLVLAEGMVSYLVDTNAVEVYDGAAWVGIGNSGDITGVTAGTGISGGGTSGTVTVTNSMATAITTAGDLIKGTGSGTFDRLGIGSAGQVLTVTAGVPAWATAAGGGSMTLLGTPLTLSGTPTITGIDQTYKDLYFLCFGFTNGATGDTVFIPNSIQLLVDFVITANSNTAAATEVKTADNIQFNLTANRQTAGSAVNFFALTIKDYASTGNRKVWNLSGTYTAASGRVNYQAQGSINTNAAITEMFIAHSVSGFTGGTVELYGVN